MSNDAVKAPEKGMGIHGRRTIAYIVLVLVSFLCLFWFYVLFINATRSHAELTKGFTPVPSSHLGENLTNIFHGTLPVVRGMINSLIIAISSAALCTYLSVYAATHKEELINNSYNPMQEVMISQTKGRRGAEAAVTADDCYFHD